MISVKSDSDIEKMRIAGGMLATVLQVVGSHVSPGISAKELALIAEKEIESLGGSPVFRGVPGGPGVEPFPDVICVSIADEVQHGIPGSRIVEEGDAVNLDLGVAYGGMITDAGRTFVAGAASPEVDKLIKGTEDALRAATDLVKEGVSVKELSAAIEDVLESRNLGIVLELVGHGVGYELHEDPEIPNYRYYGKNPKLVAGNTIAIEPIATLGNGKIKIASDGWTIISADGTQSAQTENTLLVTKDGCEILTSLPN